jgi:uncharacterized membrane protein
MTFLRRTSRQPPRDLYSVITASYLAVALALGYGVPILNRALAPQITSRLSGATLSAVLSAMAAGMMALTAIIFSLAFVIIQVATANYSPRVTRVFARMGALRHAMGIFSGAFVYCLLALSQTDVTATSHVGALTVWVALIWLLAAVGALTLLGRAFAGLTVSNLLTMLSMGAAESIDRIYTDGEAAAGGRGETTEADAMPVLQRLIHHAGPLYLTALHVPEIVSLAEASDAIIRVPHVVGDPIVEGQLLGTVHGRGTGVDERHLRSAIRLESSRALRHDPKYSLRLLVDIAIRALSPAINDPTTAVQCIDQIEGTLERLGNRHLDIGQVHDRAGRLRLVYRTSSWEDYVRLAFSEIILYGSAALQVQRRLQAAVRDLIERLAASRHPPLLEIAELCREAADAHLDSGRYRQWAARADRQGLGGSRPELEA